MLFQTISQSVSQEKKSSKQSFIIEYIVLFSLLIISNLLNDNMDDNEAGRLMLAKQLVFPEWLPDDWYLSQDQTYQILFQIIFGKMVLMWGFLATSILGRCAYYSLIALGLVLIGRQIKINFLSLFSAITIFLVSRQGIVIAGEWMIGGLETKGFSYGLIFIAIWLLMKRKYLWMSAFLGLATSFHILVGGYAALTVVMWLLWKNWQNSNIFNRHQAYLFWYIFWAIVIYLTTSSFAIIPLLGTIGNSIEPHNTTLQATYIYTFLRNPHHLDPFDWQKIRFLIIGLYLYTLFFCWSFFKKNPQLDNDINNQLSNRDSTSIMILLELTIFSLFPFFLGFLIAPFDSQGKFLQYYPFRFANLMLSLNVLIGLSYAVQVAVEKSINLRISKKNLLLVCIFVLSSIHVFTIKNFAEELYSLRRFPLVVERLTIESEAAFLWIKNNTEKDAVIISPPAQFVGFSWLTDRSSIAKFKLVPSTEPEILEWYERLNDLSGHPASWEWPQTGFKAAPLLDEDYQNLTTEQVKNLMKKYDSHYFFDERDHQLDLAIAYENKDYRIYTDN